MDVVDLDHVAIRVSDLDQALSFYHNLLSMELRDRERYDTGEVPYIAVVAGGRHIHIVPTDEEFEVEREHICFLLRSSEVDSRGELTDLLEQLQEEGFEVEDGEPHRRYGAYGRAWAAYVRDPDGRRVELKMH